MEISVEPKPATLNNKRLEQGREVYLRLLAMIHYEQGFPILQGIASVMTVACCGIHFVRTSSQPSVALGALLGSVFLLASGTLLSWAGARKKLQRNASLHLSISFVLFTCWAVFCIYTTFVEPFTLVGTSYASVWLGFASSFGMFFFRLKQSPGWMGVKANETQPVHLLLIYGPAVVATAFGGISLGSMLIFVADFEELYRYERHLGALLSLLWICGVFFLNFDYLGQVGNGFFGCWLCAVCSLLMI